MPVGRRTTLAAASGTAGAACLVAPWLTWLTDTGHVRHCGWTCYRPVPAPPNVATLAGRGGTQVALGLSGLLLVVGLLAVTVLALALRGARPPVLLGRVMTVVGFAALVWTVVVIVRYAEGGTLVSTRRDGVFAADLGAGAVVSLVGAAATVLLGGGIALQAPWAGYDGAEAAAAHRADDAAYPGRSRS